MDMIDTDLTQLEARVMARYQLTLCEWEIVLAAYAYEVRDQPTMTDASYDRRSRELAAQGTRIPGFDASTGQWVQELDREVGGLLGSLLDAALAVNDGKSDLHAPQVIHALESHGVSFPCCQPGNVCK